LIEVARDEKLERMFARVTVDNIAMQAMCRKLGFKVYHLQHGYLVEASLAL